MTPTAFAAERRRPQHHNVYRSIAPARRALSSKPAGRRCCCRPMGQTDGRTPGRYIDPAAYSMRAGSVKRRMSVLFSLILREVSYKVRSMRPSPSFRASHWPQRNFCSQPALGQFTITWYTAQTNGQSKSTKPHCRHAQIAQLHSPGGTRVHPHIIVPRCFCANVDDSIRRLSSLRIIYNPVNRRLPSVL